MILIGIGGNLASARYGAPRNTLSAALVALRAERIGVLACSGWYRSEPVPHSDQPWFVNAVAEIATDLPADRLLERLHDVEQAFGRVRTVPNAARVIDLDLLDFHGEIAPARPGKATLPHPRLQDRAFVLQPLADLAPAWRHPITGTPIEDLLKALPAGQTIEALSSQAPLPR